MNRVEPEVPRRGGRRMGRRRFLQGAASAGAVIAWYTWRWEPHWVEWVERPLPVARLPERWRGARLVQLSDLHIGPRVDDRYLLQTFRQVRGLSPDLVVYTGDFTSYEAEGLGHARRVLGEMPRGTRGTFGVLGNHDYGPGWSHPEIADGVVAAAEGAGVRVLRNELVEVGGLQVAGLDDLWAGRFDAAAGLGGLAAGGASLVLSHNPDTVDQPGWDGFEGWVLSGHTHGGQCKPPFLPPPLLPVRNRRYTSGTFALSGGRRMYISRGVGHLLRVRFNVRPEVTVFRLASA